MLDGGTAVVRVIADASKLNATIAASTKGATSGLSGIGSKVTAALSNPFVLAGGIVAGVSAKMGYDFENAFSRIDAISSASSKDIAQWRTQIESLSRTTAESPKELADALYFLASAGLKSNEVFPALEASAKAAATGLGSVAQVGSVVAAVLNAYAGSGMTATNVTDTLVAAVRESRAETDEFGQTLGRLLPISARAGITFGELAGSLASLSNIGLDVYEASTAMRAAIQAITAPGEKAANTMEAMGISSQHMLDAIHQRGLLGALKYLDTQIKANTDSESEYLRAFRDIVPNVRALTGVLGLTGSNLEHVQHIFKETTNAVGDSAEAFGVISKGPAFQFRQAINDLVITGTELGTHILPVITGALKILGPILGVVADNAGKLLVVWLGYKALTFLPALLTAIGVGAGAAAAGGAAGGAVGFGSATVEGYIAAKAAAGGLGGVLAKIAPMGAKVAAGMAVTAYALGDVSAAASTSKTDLEHLENIAKTYFAVNEAGTHAIDTSTLAIRAQAEMYHGNAAALQYATQHGVSYTKALWMISYAGDELNKHQMMVDKSLRQVVRGMDEAGNKTHKVTKAFERWGFASDKAFADFKKGIRESIATAPGQFEKLSDAFSVTPAEAQKQLSLALQITRTKIRDLKKIFSDKDLTKGQKRALAGLAPEYRRAWAEAGDAGKRSIERLATQNARAAGTSVGKIMSPFKKLKPKAEEAGRSIPTGIKMGIYAGLSSALSAAHHLVNMVNGVLQQGWKFGSPSKVTKQFGIWIIEGLIEGLKARETALTNAAEHVVTILTDQLSKTRDKYKSVLDKIKSDLQDKMGDAYSRSAYLEAVSHNVAAAAAQAAIELAKSRVKQANELQKMVSQAEKALDRLIDKFKAYKDSIKSGFDDFKDLGGIIADAWKQYSDDMAQYQQDLIAYQKELADFNTGGGTGTAPTAPTAPTINLSSLISTTVANAQRLAKDLLLAAKAGLSKGLLAQFAGQGAAGADALEQLLANPALINQLNEAYKTINAAAESTASALGNKFFGQAIKEATQEFHHATTALRGFILAMIDIIKAVGAEGQLAHILKMLQQSLQASPPGQGGPGPGGGNGPNAPGGPGWGTGWDGGGMDHVPPGTTPPTSPNIYITVNGWVGSDQQIAERVREEFLRIQRNNRTTGVH